MPGEELALIGGMLSAKTQLATSLLGTGAALWQSKKNRDLVEKQNELNRQAEQHRYDQQRQDALADWASQNQYNHPLQQMQRLREAGLNPNLVYGKGADATADSIRSSSFPSVNAPAPQNTFDTGNISRIGQSISSGINTFYDLKAKQAQTDNVNQSTALMQQESLFKQANTAKTIGETARTKFELGQAQELKDSVIENQKLTNEKLRADTQYTLDNNQRSELANSTNVKLTLEKIITEQIAHAKDKATIDQLKAQLDSLRQTQDIQTYQQKLTEMGIHQSDPWYFRGMMNLIHGNINSSPIQRLLEKVKPSGVPQYNPKLEQQWMHRKN